VQEGIYVYSFKLHTYNNDKLSYFDQSRHIVKTCTTSSK